jgi:hypothetical protein
MEHDGVQNRPIRTKCQPLEHDKQKTKRKDVNMMQYGMVKQLFFQVD